MLIQPLILNGLAKNLVNSVFSKWIFLHWPQCHMLYVLKAYNGFFFRSSLGCTIWAKSWLFYVELFPLSSIIAPDNTSIPLFKTSVFTKPTECYWSGNKRASFADFQDFQLFCRVHTRETENLFNDSHTYFKSPIFMYCTHNLMQWMLAVMCHRCSKDI
jgi:hypothetical protein